MSDTTGTEPQPNAEQQQPETPETGAEQQQPEVDYKAEFEKWKALSRKNEQLARENADKAKRFDELEEANKTELQKAIDRAEAAERRAAEADQARLRSDIARAKNVPAELLQGSNEDELNAYADQLLSFRGATPEQPAAPRSSGGDAPSGAAKPTVYRMAQLNDPAFYKANRADILRAQQEGRIIP